MRQHHRCIEHFLLHLRQKQRHSDLSDQQHHHFQQHPVFPEVLLHHPHQQDLLHQPEMPTKRLPSQQIQQLLLIDMQNCHPNQQVLLRRLNQANQPYPVYRKGQLIRPIHLRQQDLLDLLIRLHQLILLLQLILVRLRDRLLPEYLVGQEHQLQCHPIQERPEDLPVQSHRLIH